MKKRRLSLILLLAVVVFVACGKQEVVEVESTPIVPTLAMEQLATPKPTEIPPLSEEVMAYSSLQVTRMVACNEAIVALGNILELYQSDEVINGDLAYKAGVESAMLDFINELEYVCVVQYEEGDMADFSLINNLLDGFEYNYKQGIVHLRAGVSESQPEEITVGIGYIEKATSKMNEVIQYSEGK